ncbi:hypothetical protein QNN03_38375 [Streptomyces sp. GXMU-J15]|uniref:Knr4/Smi1-like domain-containing protein n=1 Tax=Streptomyces fuscus TaxID=3048495 RepID=A0ABT7JBN6_9ACTN|nr:hypothetical protein [Streptomyces fuscus]
MASQGRTSAKNGYTTSRDAIDVRAGAFGPRERYRPARPESWREIEDWAGLELPRDYKQFVDDYGDAIVFGHLFIAHPEGIDPLLKVMQEERQTFLADVEGEFDKAPGESSGLGRLLPWAYHNFNGDICLLVPPSTDKRDWNVAISFRQCPEVQIFPGGVIDFLHALVRREVPRGWPHVGFEWVSAEGSPLI